MSGRLGDPVDGSAVTRIENGSRAVRLEEAVAIAESLDVPLAMLVDAAGDHAARTAALERERRRQEDRAAAAEHEHQQAQLALAEIELQLQQLAQEERQQ